MPTRKSSAHWDGGIKTGNGTFKGESGAIGGKYTFSSRFENGVGSNPEELLAAAEAACYSMALSGNIERAGGTPTSIDTEAACTVAPLPEGGGFHITTIALTVNVKATGIDDAKFQETAQKTLQTCPVSRSFHGNVELSVTATLSS